MYHSLGSLAAGLARASIALGILAVAASIGACGGAPRRDLHATFARIQEEEARVEHAAAIAGATDDCNARRDACEDLCGASDAVCDLARESEDRDALLRCERVDARCTSCRADVACGGAS